MSDDFRGVVVAAGGATRFGAPLAKQFQDLGGRTVLERSVACLADRPGVEGVVVVLAPDVLEGARGAAVRRWPGVLDVVAGGATRSESVARGARAAGSVPFLLVHDAARPMASARVVDAVIAATRRHGAAIPVLGIPDTVKTVRGEWIDGTIDRERLRLAQTPQGCRSDWLSGALERSRVDRAVPTDEAGALERDGHKVAVVPGDPGNRKITTVEDLDAMRRSLDEGSAELRIGSGFDVHRIDDSRPLVLGGVVFEGAPGLQGHSDADVVLHAAMDAALGAAALGDIGAYFPPDDARFAGADSRVLARRVAEMVSESGFEIVNLDLTLLAEAPKIRSRVDEMREAIARSLGIEPGRVGLKATTLERLGALGRGEGMACQAVALLRRRGSVR